MTENISLFDLLRRTCFLLTFSSFAFDCPRLENLMKILGEKSILHSPSPSPMSPILTLTCYPPQNTGYSKLMSGLGLVLAACSYAYLFWVNVLWGKRLILFTCGSVPICFHFRVFAYLAENL